MAEPQMLSRMYHTIMMSFVNRGFAPHFTELATQLDLPPEEARQTLRELVELGLPGVWQRPDTDYIESFAPFHNLASQHRIEVDGESRWFGQCGFESLAVTWVFPGREVNITTPCLDCGDPIRLRMRDGELLEVDPEGVVGHTNNPFYRWRENLARS